MSFNTDALTLLALGIRDDNPVDPEQPPLVDGVHLRWYPRQDLGFPWYGFYLFRRESRSRRPRCLSGVVGGLRPGPSRSASLATRLGRIASQQPLVFTDDFPATGTVEFGLTSGLRFDLPAGVEAGSVEVRIGFRDPGLGIERKCIDFRRFPLGHGPSPRIEQEVVFETELPQVSPPILVTVIERWGDSVPGLNSSRRLQITLPREVSRVDLLLTNELAVRIEALSQQGGSVAVRELHPGELQAGVVTLTGEGITQVILQGSSVDAALLHEICFEAQTARGGESRVGVRILAGEKIVGRTIVAGTAGEVVPVSLSGDGITAVEIDPGPAALIDLCYLPVRQGVVHGWEEISGFTYPLCLPVALAAYSCPGRPVDFDEAKALALSRVTYPGPPGWEDGFAELHGQLAVLVDKGPAGGPMADRKNPDLPGEPISPATQPELPKMPGLRPLDLILLASLHPTLAQMVGLYFVDRSAELGMGYDYLLLADPNGILGGGAAGALDWLAFSADTSKLDADVVFDRKAEPRPPIAPPGAPRVYALPGAPVRTPQGDLRDAPTAAGLWWDVPAEPIPEDPDHIAFYSPKRAFLGITEPGAPPSASAYQPLPDLSPVLVARPAPEKPPPLPAPGEPRRAPDWPPSVSFHVIDGNLPEGWYSYRLAGQDLFGRRSPLGPPSPWYQWDPPPEQEPSWYWKPDVGHGAIHPFAAALLDKIPPPAPTGVEAEVLDSRDPWVLQDAAYEAWREQNKGVVGLRVRWRWTLLHQIQAPDTKEFRIYYQLGRLNALAGRIINATAASASESNVEMDIAGAHPPNAFAGARLRVGNDSFPILASQSTPTLRLRVQNLGAKDTVRPAAGRPCGIAIPEGHGLFQDFSRAKTWARRLHPVDYGSNVRIVVEPSDDPEGKTLQGRVDQGRGVTVSGLTALLPAGTDLAAVQPWLDHLWLEDDQGRADKTYPIERFDVAARTLTLTSEPVLAPQPTTWIVGRPARHYDVFLPAPDVGKGNPFEPTPAEPVVYAHIGVSAADDKTHTRDDPKWGAPPTGQRPGNEGRLGAPATIFRVLREPPLPPELPDYPERLLATPADYHSRSYFTFRWVPVEHLKAHVLRALDDSLIQVDRKQRPRPAIDLDRPEDVKLFPSTWNMDRCRKVAGELNGLNTLQPDYTQLLDDALRILAGLPGNEAAFSQVTIDPLAKDDPATFDRRGPDDLATYAPDSALRARTDDLPGRATNRYFYRAAFVDGAHNRSALSLSTPPVYLPKVTPPRAPVITKVVGGDREITIKWARNREVGLLEYRIYRSTAEADDLRSMELVHTVMAAGAAATLEIRWTDKPVPGRIDLFYRIVAVDRDGNVSSPSAAARGRATDESRPAHPAWGAAVPSPDLTTLELSWTHKQADLRCMVERSLTGLDQWLDVSGWLPRSIYQFSDSDRAAGALYDYRLRVLDRIGRQNSDFDVLTR